MCYDGHANALVPLPVGHLAVLAAVVRLLAFGAAREADPRAFRTIPANLAPKLHQSPDCRPRKSHGFCFESIPRVSFVVFSPFERTVKGLSGFSGIKSV